MNRILLIGMMGAGKTTVGHILAERTGWAYADSDAEVTARTGRTVSEIFEAEGEAAFRVEEGVALRTALSGTSPRVVSIAGGAVLDPVNRALLERSGTVVWLRARPDTLVQRLGDGAGRPLLSGDPAGVVERLDAVRRPLYAEVADVVVDVDGKSPGEVADGVLAEVERGRRAPIGPGEPR